MTDHDRVSAMAMDIGRLLDTHHATNLEAMAALATVFSVRLDGETTEVRAECCRWFVSAVMLAAEDADA